MECDDEQMANGRNEKGQFTKGRKETAEEKVKRIQAVSEAWKSRSDYIGDIKDECPKIYNSWRAMRFTEKGKKAGNSEEWNDFRTFYNDVRPFWKEGLVFRRKDTSRPFSKDNFMYVTVEEANQIKENTITIEYQGVTYTLRQASDVFGIPYNSVKNRYYKHSDTYTVEEIIFGKKRKRKDRQAKDYREDPSKIRSKASKMISTYKVKDNKMGFEKICDIDIDWMIENIITKPCIYCGDIHRVGCDRIDNDKGHTKDNVVPCCFDCNCARNDNFSFEEMKIIGKTIREVKAARPQQTTESDKLEDISNG